MPAPLRHRQTWVLVLAALLLAMPLAAGDYVRYVATLWLVYAISAMGLQIPIGLAALYSFGHGGFMLIGAYATGAGIIAGLPVALAVLLGIVLASLIGAALALPSLRLSGFGLAIVTLGAASLLFQGVKAFTVTGGTQGLFLPSLPVSKLWDGRALYLIVVACLVVAIVVARRVNQGPVGLALRATAANPLMAQGFGIHLLRIRTLAFVLSAMFGALAGGLLALLIGYVAPEAFSPELSIQVFAAVMIGGSARYWGPIVGALFIVLIPELTQSVQNLGAIIYALLFLAIAVLYPGGIQQLLSGLTGRRPSAP